MPNNLGTAISSVTQWLPKDGASVWEWIDFAFFFTLLGVSLTLVVSIAIRLLSTKGREQAIDISLLLFGGVLWFAFAAFFNFLGTPSCKANTFLEFLLLETRPFSCNRGLVLSYAFLLPVVLALVSKGLKTFYGK